VAEWFKAAVLKTVEVERLPGVRIPSSPPTFAHGSREGCPPKRQSREGGLPLLLGLSYGWQASQHA
jgi:hypothetical protein